MAAFVEFSRIYNGANNGSLALSTRTLAGQRGCSLDTAARAIRELLEKGFVEIVRASGFNVKSRLAAEYRMTLYRCDVTNAAPSKAFMRWQPKIISQYDSMGTTVRSIVRSAKKSPSQYDPSKRQAGKTANDATPSRTHIESTRSPDETDSLDEGTA
jgi:DNA-binding transcriptional regulator YhcF (GntR family)